MATVARTTTVRHPRTLEVHVLMPGDLVPGWADGLIRNPDVLIDDGGDVGATEPEIVEGGGNWHYVHYRGEKHSVRGRAAAEALALEMQEDGDVVD